MEIALTKPIEEFIESQTACGYSDASEVVRQAFLRWMEDENFRLTGPKLKEKTEEARGARFRQYSASPYQQLKETSHLLRSRANARRLRAAIASLERR